MHPAALPRAPITRRIAAFRPSWASKISSFTPRSPGRNKLIKKLAQNVSASLGPMCGPTDLAFAVGCCLSAVGQEVNDAAAFEIADNGAVALPPLPGQVVYAVDVVGACHEDLPEVDPVLAEFGDVEDIVGSVSIGVEEAVRADAVRRYGG
jgi:hypothetical protein